jgi:hypothetical protein
MERLMLFNTTMKAPHGTKMRLLSEIKNARQITGEPFRRWYTNGDVELIVWLEDYRILGYQLVVPAEHGQTAITWRDGTGLSVAGVDDGEGRTAGPKMTPILTGPEKLQPEAVLQLFRGISEGLPAGLAGVVEQTISDKREK